MKENILRVFFELAWAFSREGWACFRELERVATLGVAASSAFLPWAEVGLLRRAIRSQYIGLREKRAKLGKWSRLLKYSGKKMTSVEWRAY